MKTSGCWAIAGFATSVVAHGHVSSCKINGKQYGGVSPNIPAGTQDVIGWVVPHYGDHAFISPHEYGDPNIICHADAFPAPFHAPVAPGDTIELQWTPWDISHVGPIMDYLANCHGPCENATKADLRFFKIDEKGLVPGPGQPNGINRMASDDLRAAGSKWEVKIPSGIKPGFYVLRHEMMALHFAENPDGAQNYPNCINLEITGSGTLDPPGIPAVSMYHPTDPGVSIDIKTSLTTYQIPGPPLFDGSAAPDSVGNNGSSSGSVPAPPSPLASLPSSSAAAAQTSPSPTSTSTLDVVAAGSGSCAASAETVTTVVMVTESTYESYIRSSTSTSTSTVKIKSSLVANTNPYEAVNGTE